MIIIYIIAAFSLLGYILIIKDVFTKRPPLTPEEEKKQQLRMEAERHKDVQKLRDSANDLSFGATMVGLGLLNEAMKADEKKKK